MSRTFGPRIPHDGGPCPVAPGTHVKVWFRGAPSEPSTTSSPQTLYWGWKSRGNLGDIIAYAVAQPETPAPEPWTPYNNRVRTDLLTPEELAALKATGGPWEFYATGEGWQETAGRTPTWFHGDTYRAVRKPETREVVMHAKRDGAGKWWTYENPERPETWPWVFLLTEDANGEPVAVGNLRKKDAAP